MKIKKPILYDKLTNKLICNKYILVIYNEIPELR